MIMGGIITITTMTATNRKQRSSRLACVTSRDQRTV